MTTQRADAVARVTLTAPSAIANTIALWCAMAVCAFAWWPIYANVHFIVLAIVATVLGSGIALFGARFRWPSAIVVPAVVVTFGLVGVQLAVPSSVAGNVLPTPAGLLDLFAGVALGWKQLLTITLPVGSYQALLVPALVVFLVSPVIALTLALRSRRGELAAVVPVLATAIGLVFGPREVTGSALVALFLLAVTLLWLMAQRGFRRRRSDALVFVRAAVGGLAVITIAAVAAVGAATLVPPSAERVVLRSTVDQPFDPRSYSSPLAGFRHYFSPESKDAVLFTVSGLPSDGRIRLATLDSYDGVVYAVGSAAVASESGSFTRVPYRFDQSTIEGERVSLDIAIDAYSGVWLPTAGKFVQVSFAGGRSAQLGDAFYYNDTASTGAVIGGLSSADSYRLDAVLPVQPSHAQLASATAGGAAVAPLSTVPAELTTVLERYVDGVDGQGNRLLAMIDALRAAGYVSHGTSADEPPSRSGHSADRITQLLSEQRMIGDAEQYAVTAALMARQLGFPARVVVGFVPGDSSIVTGRMASAWIEVNTAQYGWVTIDPNPPLREIPDAQPEEPSSVSRPQSVIQPPDEDADINDNQTPAESTREDPPVTDALLLVLLALARVLGLIAVVALTVSAPFLLVIAAKLRRRQLRRRADSARSKITAGWQDLTDSALDYGYSPPPAATRNEFAATVGGRTREVALLADRAIFSPGEPGVRDAIELWRAVDEIRASMALGKTRWQRLRALISVRSLGGYGARRVLQRGRRNDV